MVKRLRWMETVLLDMLETQFTCLEEVCTKELGEAVDMIKDLEEAIYYNTITEAMKKEKGDQSTYSWHEEANDHPVATMTVKEEWDAWLGQSPHSRKKYLEAKEIGKDKATQLRELEKYITELGADITAMIADASSEEKQYLEKKITALASKISQMK